MKRSVGCNFCSKLYQIFQGLKFIFKADSLGVLIVKVLLEKPKTEIYVFDRATLSGFATRELTIKSDLNTKNHVRLLIILKPSFV